MVGVVTGPIPGPHLQVPLEVPHPAPPGTDDLGHLAGAGAGRGQVAPAGGPLFEP